MSHFFKICQSYLSQNSSYLIEQVAKHLTLSLFSILLCLIIGLPIGILLYYKKSWQAPCLALVNILQTIPSMAMLTFLLIIFGLRTATIILLIVIYSILPIIKNTAIGLESVSPVYLDSGKALGMTTWQLLYQVQLPLSATIILAGLKNALILAVSNTTATAFIGAGGLGDIILRGINIVDGSPIILTGALLCALIAFLLEYVIKHFEKRLA